MDRLLDLADLLGAGVPPDPADREDHSASARALLDTLSGAEAALRALAKTQRRVVSELDAELAKLEGDIDRLLQKGQSDLARHRILALLYKQELATAMRRHGSETERILHRTEAARERLLAALTTPAQSGESYPLPRAWRLSARLDEAATVLQERRSRLPRERTPDPHPAT